MTSLQVIQQSDAKTAPLYGVHLLGQDAHFYRPLANALGPDVSVFGIGGGDFGETPAEEMSRVAVRADEYAAAILAHTDLPRIALGAFSMAGTVSYEVGRRIALAGREVLLVLFDARGPGARDVPKAKRVRIHLSQLRVRGLPYVQERLRARAEEGLAEGDEAEEPDFIALADLHDFGESTTAEAVLYLAMGERAIDFLEPAYIESGLGWRPLVRSLDVVRVHGEHLTILEEPFVGAIAADLRTRLVE